jgi:DNA polymerase V
MYMQPTGFPSPAADYIEKKLDLNELLVKHPAATFFMRVKEGGMPKSDICAGDILLVDRSLVPRDQDIVIAIIDGEFKLTHFQPQRFKKKTEGTFELWGVVSWVLHELRAKA